MKKNTTVAISSQHDQILTQLCLQAQASKKEYLEKAIEYFQRFGVNPIAFDSPSDEMKKLIKKMDQVIAFQRRQEIDMLKPFCLSVLQNEKAMQAKLANLNKLVPSEKMDASIEGTKQYIKTCTEFLNKNMIAYNKKQLESLIHIATLVDKNNNTGLAQKIKNIFE